MAVYVPPQTPTPDPPETTVWVHRLTTLFAWAVALVLFLWFFQAFRVVLLGFLAALCFAAALRPLRDHLPGPRWLRAMLAGLVTPLLLAGLVGLLWWLMADRVRREWQHWPQTRDRINELMGNWGHRLGLDSELTIQSAIQQLSDFLAGGQVISKTTAVVSGSLIALVFIIFGAIFIMGATERQFMNPMQRLLPAHRRPQALAVVDELDLKLRWWLIGTLISMAIVGVVSWIGYSLVGLQLATPLALLAGVAEIVPTLGPLFAFVIALLVAATQGSSTFWGVIIVYCVVQLLESYVILPWVMREVVRIAPVVTLFSVVFWGAVFGTPGLLLALPLDLVLWSVLKHFVMADPDASSQPRAPPGAQSA